MAGTHVAHEADVPEHGSDRSVIASGSPAGTPLARALVALVRGYQRHASPGIRTACRYTPTCSEYAIRAVEKYGAVGGSRRALARFRRCRPPHGGLDEP